MKSINLNIILLKDSNTLTAGSASFPTFDIARPINIENITSAIIFSFVNNNEKSLTLIASTVLDNILIFSLSFVLSLPNTSIILLESLVSTSFIELVTTRPTRAATIDVTKNVKNIVINTFPNLFGSFILAIDTVIVKNISGTIITNIRFIYKSPSGLSTVTFSLKIRPNIPPIITPNNNSIVPL